MFRWALMSANLSERSVLFHFRFDCTSGAAGGRFGLCVSVNLAIDHTYGISVAGDPDAAGRFPKSQTDGNTTPWDLVELRSFVKLQREPGMV